MSSWVGQVWCLVAKQQPQQVQIAMRGTVVIQGVSKGADEFQNKNISSSSEMWQSRLQHRGATSSRDVCSFTYHQTLGRNISIYRAKERHRRVLDVSAYLTYALRSIWRHHLRKCEICKRGILGLFSRKPRSHRCRKQARCLEREVNAIGRGAVQSPPPTFPLASLHQSCLSKFPGFSSSPTTDGLCSSSISIDRGHCKVGKVDCTSVIVSSKRLQGPNYCIAIHHYFLPGIQSCAHSTSTK